MTRLCCDDGNAEKSLLFEKKIIHVTPVRRAEKIRDVKNPLVPLTGTGIKTVDKIEKIINMPP